jgi:hypothetical protein
MNPSRMKRQFVYVVPYTLAAAVGTRREIKWSKREDYGSGNGDPRYHTQVFTGTEKKKKTNRALYEDTGSFFSGSLIPTRRIAILLDGVNGIFIYSPPLGSIRITKREREREREQENPNFCDGLVRVSTHVVRMCSRQDSLNG